MARTAGHPLSVVEYLRALAQGDAGVPESLADAVLTRVARLDDAAAPWSRPPRWCAAASTRRCWPRWWSRPRSPPPARCEELVRLRLLVRSGDHYEFANDLIQECVHAALPPALAARLPPPGRRPHADRPEEMAEHAYAAGDEPRAAQGWLLAGEAALHRAAVEDALGLLDRSLAVETAFAGTRARALLARGAVHDARTEFADALVDIDAALALARSSRRPPPGDGRAADARRRRGRRSRADRRRAGAPAGGGAPRWRPTSATAARRRTSAAGSPSSKPAGYAWPPRWPGPSGRSPAPGLPARRTPWCSPSTASRPSGPTSANPPARRGGRASSSPCSAARATPGCCSGRCSSRRSCPPGEGRLDEARGRVAEAIELNRLSGYPAYAGYLRAHDGWYARLAGDLDTARRIGRDAARGDLTGQPPVVVRHRRRAARCHPRRDRRPRRGRGASRGVGWRLARPPWPAGGCGAWPRWPPSATSTPRPRPAGLLDAIECPPGHAWVTGADVLPAARSHRPARRGHPGLLAPPRAPRLPGRRRWTTSRGAGDATATQIRSRTS